MEIVNSERIQQIIKEMKAIEGKYAVEIEKLKSKLQQLKKICTHPELGEEFMFVCPDCKYNGSPEFPEELSDRDYENYEVNSEKTRKWRRALKAKFTREEIKSMYFTTKERLDSIAREIAVYCEPLIKEWRELVPPGHLF